MKVVTKKYATGFPEKTLRLRVNDVDTLENMVKKGMKAPTLVGMPKNEIFVELQGLYELMYVNYPNKEGKILKKCKGQYLNAVVQGSSIVGLIVSDSMADVITNLIISKKDVLYLPAKAESSNLSSIFPMVAYSRPFVTEIIDDFVGPDYIPDTISEVNSEYVQDKIINEKPVTRKPRISGSVRPDLVRGTKEKVKLSLNDTLSGDTFSEPVNVDVVPHNFSIRSSNRKSHDSYSIPPYIVIPNIEYKGQPVILSQRAMECYKRVRGLWNSSELADLEPAICSALLQKPISVGKNGSVHYCSPYYFRVTLGLIDNINIKNEIVPIEENLINE